MSVTRRFSLWGAPVVALFLTLPVFAEEPRDMLKRMVDAAREQSYYGSFIYERTGSFSTHQVWRQRDGDQTSERLLQTDGAPQEWLTRNGNLVCSSSVALRTDWKASGQPSEQLDLLHNWYTLKMLGLNLGELPANSLQPSSICLSSQASPDERADAVEAWMPGWLPPGFVLGHREVSSINDGNGQVITQVFTDGLARLTLFVEPLGVDTLADDLRAQLGPTVAISRRLVRAGGDYLATVVGEVPVAAAERVADSFEVDAESAQP